MLGHQIEWMSQNPGSKDDGPRRLGNDGRGYRIIEQHFG
jgi:hypothetical protein